MKKVKVKRKLLTMDNGLKVLLFEHPYTYKFYAEYKTKASTSTNPRGKEGLAHFLEHVMARQSTKFPSQIKLAESLEEIGAVKGAATGPFSTKYQIAGDIEDGKYLTQVLADIVINPHITSESVLGERLVIEKEIIRTKASNEGLARDLLWKVMFAGSPIAFSNLGTVDRLKKITIGDLRQFHTTKYVSNNSILGIASGLSIAKMENFVEKNFSSLRKGDWLDPKFTFKRGKPFVVVKKDTSQVSTQIGFRFENDISEKYTAAVVRALLCKGRSSRLPNRLRIKESLIYSWRSHSLVGHDTSGIFFHLSTSKQKFSRFQKVVAEEILRFVNDGVTEQELSRAKSFITKPIRRSMETAGDYISWYLYQEFFWPDDVDGPEDYEKKINKVSAQDIKRLSKKYFRDDNWYMSVVGSVEDKDVIFQL